VPGLQDGDEPGVELLKGCHLVKQTCVDEPDLAGIAHDGVAAVEHGRRHAVDCHVGRLVHDAGGLVQLEEERCRDV
jgi:hypothetical protein